MSQPTQADIIDPVLTQLAQVYMQDQKNFVADKIAPSVKVNNQAGKFYKVAKDLVFADEAKRRAPATESAGSGYTLSNDSYHCDVWAIHQDVDHQLKAQAASPFEWSQMAMQQVAHKMLLRREALMIEAAFGTSIWDTDNTLSGSNQWDDSTSAVMSQIDTAKETIMASTGREPNTLVLDYRVYNALRQHPEIRARLGTTSDRPLDADAMDIARVLGVANVHVLKAVKNSSVEGATASMSFVGGKHALLCYIPETPSMLAPSALYTFEWANLNPGFGGIAMSSFEMPHLKATRIEGELAIDIKVTGSDLGYFFASAVS